MSERRRSPPFLAPVGRLDKASEGLLPLTNDSRWSSRLFDPASHVDSVYHVQVRDTELDACVESRPASSNTRGARRSRSKRSRCCARARAAAPGRMFSPRVDMEEGGHDRFETHAFRYTVLSQLR
jgi:16S rRNA U516 pseudouridylate synthase RsuA-like enzyme